MVSAEPLPDPSKFERREDETDKQANKRKNADIQAEYNAMACVALYMLLMSFSQKGIDKLADFQEHMKMKHPDGEFVVSEGFDDGKFVHAGGSCSLLSTRLPGCCFESHIFHTN